MYRLLICSALALSSLVSSEAGYFELQDSQYTGDQFFNVENVDGQNTLGVNDIVRSVQRFAYLDSLGATRTALAISIAKVTGVPTGDEVNNGGTRNYSFGATTDTATSSGIDSIAELSAAMSQTNFEATGATASADVFALLTTAGNVSLAASGFNFTAANFGLTLGIWDLDMTAGFDGSNNYMAFRGDYFGDIVPGLFVTLDPVTQPNNTSIFPGDSTRFSQRFAYTITGLHDDDNDYTAGDSLQTFTFDTYSGSTVTANVGTTSSNLMVWESLGSSPSGTDFSSTNVVVNIAAPGAVPEPTSLAVMLGLTVVGAMGRRRKA